METPNNPNVTIIAYLKLFLTLSFLLYSFLKNLKKEYKRIKKRENIETIKRKTNTKRLR